MDEAQLVSRGLSCPSPRLPYPIHHRQLKLLAPTHPLVKRQEMAEQDFELAVASVA